MSKTQKIILLITLILIMPVLLTSCNTNYNDYYYKPTGKVFMNNDEIFKKGFATDNNGYDLKSDEVNRLISVVPSQRQLDYLELEYYNFIHYGMNTFTGKEWGTGKENPNKFNPKIVDTDQWCDVIKKSGSKGVIFTAKHHDGFCLWQTATTEHSIKNSPYQNGKGDIVKQMADSCKKYGLKLGLYLSPWDRNCSVYGTDKYNDFFKAQLTELLDGRYGEIFSIWFDGAMGDSNIDPDFKYDMEGYEKIIRELQPNCVSALQGSDVRWVGNEAGVSRENEWSIISEGSEASLEYQTSEDGADKLQSVKYNDSDVGSRDLLKKYKDLIFKPAEVDVSIHKGWFYHTLQGPKKLDHLMKIYHKSVGGNSNLLLNICPSKKGIIEKRDVRRLEEFGNAIKKSKSNPIRIKNIMVGNYDKMVELNENDKNNILNEERYTEYVFNDDQYIIDFNFNEPTALRRIDIREDLRYSQRIEAYDIYFKVDNGWELLANCGNVGNRRTTVVSNESNIVTSAVRIVVRQSRDIPHIRFVGLYA